MKATNKVCEQLHCLLVINCLHLKPLLNSIHNHQAPLMKTIVTWTRGRTTGARILCLFKPIYLYYTTVFYPAIYVFKAIHIRAIRLYIILLNSESKHLDGHNKHTIRSRPWHVWIMHICSTPVFRYKNTKKSDSSCLRDWSEVRSMDAWVSMQSGRQLSLSVLNWKSRNLLDGRLVRGRFVW